VSLSPYDRNLLDSCLERKPRSWEEFVNRYLGLVTHVVNHTARCRSIRLSSQDFEDLVSEVFLAIIDDDFAALRRFRGQSSLATYLAVIARRVVVHELLKRKTQMNLGDLAQDTPTDQVPHEERISNREEVERLLQELNGPEAEVVRLYHLEGKTYDEISSAIGMATNSIGPTLSRARAKLRQAGSI
jgi:RNA polymerase sigma-70 factor, ECF subfamily